MSTWAHKFGSSPYTKKYKKKSTKVITTVRKPKKKLASYVKVGLQNLPVQVRPEIKRFDNAAWNAETIDNAAAWSFNAHATDIVEGDEPYNRTGGQIFVKYITGRARIATSPDMPNGGTAVRFMAIMDREPAASNAVTPTFATIFADQATDELDYCAPLNSNSSGRFKILYERRVVLRNMQSKVPPGPADQSTIDIKFLKFKIPVNKRLRYNAGAGLQNVTAGCYIYFVAYSDLTATTPKIDMVTRTYFTDV